MDKRNDEQEKAGSLPHDTTKCTLHLYKISITITGKSVTKNEMDRKRMIRRRLILSYMVHLVIPYICTKFQNSSCKGS